MLGGCVDDYVSLSCFRVYAPSVDLYCVCLKDLPRKVTWNTFFNPSCDFSKIFDKVKRVLLVFDVILVTTSYLIFSKLWFEEFDKLPHVFYGI